MKKNKIVLGFIDGFLFIQLIEQKKSQKFTSTELMIKVFLFLLKTNKS